MSIRPYFDGAALPISLARRRLWERQVVRIDAPLEAIAAPGPNERSIHVYDRRELTRIDLETGERSVIASVVEPSNDQESFIDQEFAFSENGRRLIVVAPVRGRWLIDAETGEIRELPGSTLSGVNAVGFSPSGRLAFAADRDGEILVWDATTGEERARFSAPGGNDDSAEAAIGPDDNRIAAIFGGDLLAIGSISDGTWSTTVDVDISRPRLAFNGDGSSFAVGDNKGAMRLFDAETGALIGAPGSTRRAFVHQVLALADGDYFAVASADDVLRIYSIDDMSSPEVAYAGHGSAIISVAPWPTGPDDMITASRDGTARIWRAPEGTGAFYATEPLEGILGAAALSPDGRRLVLYDSARQALAFEDLETGERRVPLEGAALVEAYGGALTRLEFFPDGGRLAAGLDRRAGALLILDGRTGAVVGRLDDAPNLEIARLAISADGSRVAALYETRVLVWDVASGGAPMLDLSGDEMGEGFVVALSPDGALLATGHRSTLRLHDIETGVLTASIPELVSPIIEANFDPSGERIVVADRDGVRIWNYETATPLLALDVGSQPALYARFSVDGARMATVTVDGVVKAWDARLGVELIAPISIPIQLRGPSALGAMWAAIDADGARLATVDRTADQIEIWRLPVRGPELVGLAKSAAPRCLSPDQRRRFQLPPEPPRWCVTGVGNEGETDRANWKPLWPYDREEWIAWLEARDRGEDADPPAR